MRVFSYSHFNKITPARMGMGFAWIGVLIYAASSSIATVLVDIGAASPVSGGRNAITFTNLFFLGSLISLVPLFAMFRGDWTRENLRRLTQRDWMLLTLSAFLSSAMTPGLFIFALEQSSVTNIVLISRIEPPLFLLAAGLVLKERINPRALLAGLIALFGAGWIMALREPGPLGVLGIGEITAILATFSYVASALVARQALKTLPMGIFSIYRTAAGTLLYFLLISVLQGPQQFQDVMSPVLLTWIWLYALPVVVIGQLAWSLALKYAQSGDLALASSVSPLAAIIFAMLLLCEDPGPGFLPGGALILLAIFFGNVKAPVMPQIIHCLNRLRLTLGGVVARGKTACALRYHGAPVT